MTSPLIFTLGSAGVPVLQGKGFTVFRYRAASAGGNKRNGSRHVFSGPFHWTRTLAKSSTAGHILRPSVTEKRRQFNMFGPGARRLTKENSDG